MKVPTSWASPSLALVGFFLQCCPIRKVTEFPLHTLRAVHIRRCKYLRSHQTSSVPLNSVQYCTWTRDSGRQPCQCTRCYGRTSPSNPLSRQFRAKLGLNRSQYRCLKRRAVAQRVDHFCSCTRSQHRVLGLGINNVCTEEHDAQRYRPPARSGRIDRQMLLL